MAANEKVGEVWIYGDIVDSKFWDDDISPTKIKDILDEIGTVGTLNIRVNSYGGSVYAGNAIISILDGYRKRTGSTINAYIEGIAASMGSNIPMVADHIYMADNALMMMHKPFTVVLGNSTDLEKELEVLEKAEQTLISNYMRHFNGTVDELKKMLANETWLTAQEALEYGLCNEITGSVEIAASAKGLFINGNEFNKKEIVAKFGFNNPIAAKRKEEKKVFVYDTALEEFGISEEKFKTFEIEAEKLINILNQTSKASSPVQCGFITAEMVKDDFENETAQDIIDYAKAGKAIDTKMQSKAKAYDKLVSNAIDTAIMSGIRAKGDKFNEAKWRKIFATLDYDEIIDQIAEWDNESLEILKAGQRFSTPENQIDVEKKAVDMEKFKF